MRILMLVPDIHIIDRRVIQQATALIGEGHNVTLLAGFECDKESHYVMHEIDIHRYVYCLNQNQLTVVKGFLPKNNSILRLGFHIYNFIKPLLSLSSFDSFVLSQARRFMFDAVHVHDLPLLKHGVILSRERKCPLIYDAHEIYYEQHILSKSERQRLKKEEINHIQYVDLFITVNPGCADYFESLHGRRPLVIMNCAEKPKESFKKSRSTLRQVAGLPDHSKIVLFQGWVSVERNLNTLVDSAEHLPDDTFLVIIGYGPYEQQLRNLIATSQGKEKIRFLGRVEPERILSLTAGAEVGIVPYLPVDLNHVSRSPNKVFEFIMAGIPIISHDLPFMCFLAEKYGIVEIGDLSSPIPMAATIKSVIENEKKIETMRHLCGTATETLNWEVEAKKLIRSYP